MKLDILVTRFGEGVISHEQFECEDSNVINRDVYANSKYADYIHKILTDNEVWSCILIDGKSYGLHIYIDEPEMAQKKIDKLVYKARVTNLANSLTKNKDYRNLISQYYGERKNLQTLQNYVDSLYSKLKEKFPDFHFEDID